MRRKLVPGAFPSQFPNCPTYISKDVLPPRSDVATSGARFRAQEEQLNQSIQEFFDSQKVSSLDELVEKLNSENFPGKLIGYSQFN